jgi:hypothetical protein
MRGTSNQPMEAFSSEVSEDEHLMVLKRDNCTPRTDKMEIRKLCRSVLYFRDRGKTFPFDPSALDNDIVSCANFPADISSNLRS